MVTFNDARESPTRRPVVGRNHRVVDCGKFGGFSEIPIPNTLNYLIQVLLQKPHLMCLGFDEGVVS
jgi:hypothetical protein